MFLKRIAYVLRKLTGLLLAPTVLLLCLSGELHAADFSKANELYRQGLYKEAFEQYRTLLTAPLVAPESAAKALQHAVDSLRRLNRLEEFDGFLEEVIQLQSDHWQVLAEAARQYRGVAHHGYLVSGTFQRGSGTGRGEWVNARERDRIRAIQLARAALNAAQNASPKQQAALYYELVMALQEGRIGTEQWRLYAKTNIEQLPELQGGQQQYGGFFGQAPGAPVDEDGNPIFFEVPRSFEQADTDGERWRWALAQVVRLDPGRTPEVALHRADMLLQLYRAVPLDGVSPIPTGDGSTERAEAYQLHTLSDEETIARLASGVRKISLPDEQNYIKLYRSAAESKQSSKIEKTRAYSSLAEVYTHRQQYPKAAAAWRNAVEFASGSDLQRARASLEQIVGAWARFEPLSVQAAGSPANVSLRFRNAKRVRFRASEVQLDAWIASIKEYVASNPQRVDWNTIRIDQLGMQIIREGKDKIVGEQIADWSAELQPAEDHFDKIITIQTPLRKSGLYLLTADIVGGNAASILVWIRSLSLVAKPTGVGSLYFVARADNGEPVSDADLSFYGFAREEANPRGRYQPKTDIKQHSGKTDSEGLLQLSEKQLPREYQWLIEARHGKERAYLGFQNIWHGSGRYSAFRQSNRGSKVFGISSQPVYRPGQTAQLALWLQQPSYDSKKQTALAGKEIELKITTPRGETLTSFRKTTDVFGGVQAEVPLPEDAPLGVYRVYVEGPYQSSLGFRVEEYKKPEFEISIDGPKEQLTLGERFSVRVQAAYLHGAPLTAGTVEYKILRSPFEEQWFPWDPWNGFYGPGYWWFCEPYPWYPGWQQWGNYGPARAWLPPIPRPPPELVAQGSGALSGDGSFTVEIDTSLAKVLHGDSAQQYRIEAAVTDASRRTVMGSGSVAVSNGKAALRMWVGRGYYQAGEEIEAHVSVRSSTGDPLQLPGIFRVLQINFKSDGTPQEQTIDSFGVESDEDGLLTQRFIPPGPGQYRLSFVTEYRGESQESGYVVSVFGDSDAQDIYRFNPLEILVEKRTYKPGETVRVQIASSFPGATVLLFVRPEYGVYPLPQVITLAGRSGSYAFELSEEDMPNMFIEAMSVHGGVLHSAIQEVFVPPRGRNLTIELLDVPERSKPSSEVRIALKVTDFEGKPFVGSTVVTVYDKALEYISGGYPSPDIFEFFWKWRRTHYPRADANLLRREMSVSPTGDKIMRIFAWKPTGRERIALTGGASERRQPSLDALSQGVETFGSFSEAKAVPEAAAPQAGEVGFDQAQTAGFAEATIRSDFADAAYWHAGVTTDEQGKAEVSFSLPEDLTTWKLRSWVVGKRAEAGQSSSEFVSTKDLLLRLQAPRFLIEGDQAVVSANIHNYLPDAAEVEGRLEVEQNVEALAGERQRAEIAPGDETRFDWRVAAKQEGEAIIRMFALSEVESDAVEKRFPVYVHGIEQLESYSATIPASKNAAEIEFVVPEQRRIEQSQFELRYSPSIALAIIDAIPYLIEYPYGCTEQTLSRFLPAVLVSKSLKKLGIVLPKLGEVEGKLDPQRRESARSRWEGYAKTPIFNQAAARKMTESGLARLSSMQLPDGGWGWFAGGRANAHTTAYVVHGLQRAEELGILSEASVLKRGVSWLMRYEAAQVRKLQNNQNQNSEQSKERKRHSDNLDAFIRIVLSRSGVENEAMLNFLLRDRKELSVYGKALLGLSLYREKRKEELELLLRDISQYLVEDQQNQTAYLKLPNEQYWWFWYGSTIETHAYYLKLLTAVEPTSNVAAGIAKYLLNNRRGGRHWASTRDTAIVVEALVDFAAASGETKPNMQLQLLLDGQEVKRVEIDAASLLTFDNAFVLKGAALTSGAHNIRLQKSGEGVVYAAATLSTFALKESIKPTGLEIRVRRRFFRLTPKASETLVPSSSGKAVTQQREEYHRESLEDVLAIQSGDLIEVELTIETKNEYEYLILEDMKAAGFESLEVQSGYNGNELGAYVEYRDNRVVLFVDYLPRGTHSVSYRLRAETPGTFTALPTKASAMYAPELRANSRQERFVIEER